jgi:hypothetical protein
MHNDAKLKLTMNLTQKISYIHTFFMSNAPLDREYALMAGFPPKRLMDPNKTLGELGLKNATIT